MVPPASARIPRVPAYSGTAPSRAPLLRVRGFHPVPPAFPDRSARKVLSAGLPGAALQPHADRSAWFGLFPFRSPLLRESRLDFLSCRYLDGSLPCVCPHVPYRFRAWCQRSALAGYPIRRSVDRRSLAPPHGFSQLSASFLAWQLLGILHGPLFT